MGRRGRGGATARRIAARAGVNLLALQQFADSALPIGAVAHSFGLESLAEDGLLREDNIEEFLRGYLHEAGVLEAAYCAESCVLAWTPQAWLELNQELSARKIARESREASIALGRRFLNLAAAASKHPLLRQAAQYTDEAHLATSFGLFAGAMSIAPEVAAAAYLQQTVTSLLSCCQRLLALGQTRAHQILWELKPEILAAGRRGAAADASRVGSFMPLLEVASARHPSLGTRLFMS